jgi:hypothetical protein
MDRSWPWLRTRAPVAVACGPSRRDQDAGEPLVGTVLGGQPVHARGGRCIRSAVNISPWR